MVQIMNAVMLFDSDDPRCDAPLQILMDALEEAESKCGDTMLAVAIALDVLRMFAGDENQEAFRALLRRLDNAK